MGPFTKEFIVTLAGIVIVAGTLVGGYSLQKEITGLQNRPAELVVDKIVVSPTVIPTATPSAMLKSRIYTPASASAVKGGVK